MPKRIKLQNPNYIFIIGFNKTGTTSLHELFCKNGFASLHWDSGRAALRMKRNINRGRPPLRGYDSKFRVFSDLNYFHPSKIIEGGSFFKELDASYPDSYFILNTRPVDGWIKSRQQKRFQRFNMTFVQLAMEAYSLDSESQVLEVWSNQLETHLKSVRGHFKDRKNFLELDITQDLVEEQLASFLGQKIQKGTWGHVRTNHLGID
jgi:hypothetical protein